MEQKKEKYRHWLWLSPYPYENERKGYRPMIYLLVENDIDDLIKSLENLKKNHPNGYIRIESQIAIIDAD